MLFLLSVVLYGMWASSQLVADESSLEYYHFREERGVFWKNDASIDSAGVADVDVGWSRDDGAVGMA